MSRDDGSIHSFGVAYLLDWAEQRLLARVLSSLGFTLERHDQFAGLSGVEHRSVVIGHSDALKHAVVVQRGMQAAYGVGRRRGTLRGLQEAPSEPLQTALSWAAPGLLSLAEREDLVRRQVLFEGYDVQARLQAEGTACDLLFFLNAAAFEALGLARISGQGFVPLKEGGALPIGITGTQYHAAKPFPRLQRKELVRNATGVGACFVGLDDFSPSQLSLLTSDEEPSEAQVRELLRRLRVEQYFRPPADEFLLGLAAEPGGASDELIVAAAGVTHELRHPLTTPSRVGISSDDPLEVARALADEKGLRYKGSIAHVTDDGRKVVHEIQTTPQESWLKKVGSIAGLLTRVRALLGSP